MYNRDINILFINVNVNINLIIYKFKYKFYILENTWVPNVWIAQYDWIALV